MSPFCGEARPPFNHFHNRLLRRKENIMHVTHCVLPFNKQGNQWEENENRFTAWKERRNGRKGIAAMLIVRTGGSPMSIETPLLVNREQRGEGKPPPPLDHCVYIMVVRNWGEMIYLSETYECGHLFDGRNDSSAFVNQTELFICEYSGFYIARSHRSQLRSCVWGQPTWKGASEWLIQARNAWGYDDGGKRHYYGIPHGASHWNTR